jgi:hypothetical protein
MSKVYNYMILAVGLTFLLKFAGIPSGADAFISWLGLSGDAGGISLGTFFLGVAALFIVGTGSGIAISFFTKSSSETWIVAPIAAGIFTVITSTFISVINYTADFGFVYYITWLIFMPLLSAFAIAIIQFWRGTD